jgi:hypothetical protein
VVTQQNAETSAGALGVTLLRSEIGYMLEAEIIP